MNRRLEAEKLKEARETIVWADEFPLEYRASAVTRAGYLLLGEVDRLQKLEDKVRKLLAEKREESAELDEEAEECREWELWEGLERVIERDMPVVWAEIKLLEALFAE